MKDFAGNELHVGDRVAKAERHGSSGAFLEERVVERIEGDRLYLARRPDWLGSDKKMGRNSVSCIPNRLVKLP